MNMTAGKYDSDKQVNTVAVGHDSKCQIYQLRLARDRSRFKTGSLRVNNSSILFVQISEPVANGGTPHAKTNGPRLVFDVTALKSVQTDFK